MFTAFLTSAEHFYIFQLPDGANAMIVGKMGDLEQPLLFVGGNCAIQGFDHTGEDKFWTVSQFCKDLCLSKLTQGTSLGDR